MNSLRLLRLAVWQSRCLCRSTNSNKYWQFVWPRRENDWIYSVVNKNMNIPLQKIFIDEKLSWDVNKSHEKFIKVSFEHEDIDLGSNKQIVDRLFRDLPKLDLEEFVKVLLATKNFECKAMGDIFSKLCVGFARKLRSYALDLDINNKDAIDQALYLANIGYELQLDTIIDYHEKLIDRLTTANLNTPQLINVLFLINLRRYVTSSRFERFVHRIVDAREKFTYEEMATICSFFVKKEKMMPQFLLIAVIDKLNDFLKHLPSNAPIDNICFSSYVKAINAGFVDFSFTKSFQIVYDNVNLTLNLLEPHLAKLDLNSFAHLLTMKTHLGTYNPLYMGAALAKVSENATKARIKEVERILYGFCYFLPKALLRKPTVFGRLSNILSSHKDVYDFPNNFLCLVYYFTVFEKYYEELFRTCFSKSFIDILMSKCFA